MIPPIAAVVRTPGVSRAQSRGQGRDDEGEEVREGDRDNTRQSVKTRNKHLLKVNSLLIFAVTWMTEKSLSQVYLASLAQLLVVLLVVVSLTEVKEVRDFQRRNSWIWAVASGVQVH